MHVGGVVNCVQEMNKLSEFQPWSFLLPLTFMLSLIWVNLLVLFQTVSLNFISYFFTSEFLVTLLASLILWPFPELHSTMPAPQPAASFTEATSCTASVPLLVPAPCRYLRSSSARLWGNMSTSIFLLTVSQVCQFESIFKPPFLGQAPLQYFHTTPTPNLLQIVSRSSSGFCLRAWTLQVWVWMCYWVS